MKILIISFLLLSLVKPAHSYTQTFTLSGAITNEEQQPVSFANLTLQEFSISIMSDQNGNYIFSAIPEGTYYIYISRTGYINKTVKVELTSADLKLNITLAKSLIETPTIDVTGSFSPTDISNSSFSITSINTRTMGRIRNENIASTIQNVVGVNNLSTGTAIGKPVIRGLTSQGVVVVHDGIKHESQQWGDEHAPEISVFDIDRIEILRGPASLIYGADGIGGVVNIVSKPLQFSSKKKAVTYGTLDFNGFSMNTEGAGNLMLGIGTQNFGIKGYAGYRKGEDIKTPDGELTINTPYGQSIIQGGNLFNSGTNEFQAGAKLGFKETFGSIIAEYQNFNRKIQIHEDPAEEPNATPNQKIVTNNFEGKGNIRLSKFLQLEPILSYETQDRKEFESTEDMDNNNPILNLDLKIFQGDIRLNHILTKDINGTFGLSAIASSNRTLAEEKLIPNYNSTGLGIYLSEKLEKKLYTVSVGFRFDKKNENIKQTIMKEDENGEPVKVISPRDFSFNSFTGSLGFVYKPFSSIDVYANLGTGWVPPSEFDMYSDGVHEGTGRFDRGLITLNSSLNPDPEESLNLDLGARLRTKYFNGELSFFQTTVNNFIFASPTGEVDSVSNLPIFDIEQSNSTFIGYEYNLQVQPVKWALITFKGDYVNTNNESINTALPFTPPAKNIIEIKLQKDNFGILYNPYFNFSTKIVSSAKKVAPLEATTEGYTLLNAGLGFDFALSKSITSVDFSISNLTNKKYVDHLSRYRYYAMNPGISFNFKLTVPFQF